MAAHQHRYEFVTDWHASPGGGFYQTIRPGRRCKCGVREPLNVDPVASARAFYLRWRGFRSASAPSG